MKYFYLKAVSALIVIIVAIGIAVQVVYPDPKAAKNTKAVQSLMDTLADGHVHISSELIDFSEHEITECNMTNALDNYSLAKQFLGDSYSGSGAAYTSNEGTLTINGSYMNYTPHTPKFSADTRSLTISNAGEIAARLCSEYGIDIHDCRMDISGGRGNISVSVIRNLDALPVFDNAFVMVMGINGLRSLSGVHFTPDMNGAKKRTALSMPDALIKFMNECTDQSREIIITDVQLGYKMVDPTLQSTPVIPVWRIIVENSAVYYIEA